MPNKRTVFFSFFCLLLLTSCGFQLRGMATIPTSLNNVLVINHGVEPLLLETLNDQLTAMDLHLVTNVKMAAYQLILEKAEFQKRMTAVAASTTPRQYQLAYIFYYSLLNSKGRKLNHTDKILILRQLTVNNNRVLGSSYEEQVIKREMQKAAAIELINQLTTAHAY